MEKVTLYPHSQGVKARSISSMGSMHSGHTSAFSTWDISEGGGEEEEGLLGKEKSIGRKDQIFERK